MSDMHYNNENCVYNDIHSHFTWFSGFVILSVCYSGFSCTNQGFIQDYLLEGGNLVHACTRFFGLLCSFSTIHTILFLRTKVEV